MTVKLNEMTPEQRDAYYAFRAGFVDAASGKQSTGYARTQIDPKEMTYAYKTGYEVGEKMLEEEWEKFTSSWEAYRYL